MFEKILIFFKIISSGNEKHNLSKWFYSVNIMSVVFWS